MCSAPNAEPHKGEGEGAGTGGSMHVCVCVWGAEREGGEGGEGEWGYLGVAEAQADGARVGAQDRDLHRAQCPFS